MKIEKTDYSYMVTECDLNFGEQITLREELLIPASILDKMRAELEQIKINNKDYIRNTKYYRAGINTAINVINKYKKIESEKV